MSINANNITLSEILETINELPSSKEEQSKTIDITENGTTVVTPDEGMTLGGVTVNVAIESGGGGTEELENLIDESGVLDSTDGTSTEKVEQLIDKAQWENFLYEQSLIWTFQFKGLFDYAQTKTMPRLRFDNATDCSIFARRSSIEDIDYLIESKVDNLIINHMFQDTKNLKHIVGIKANSLKRVDYMFSGSAIEVIDEPFDFSGVLQASWCKGTFNCDNLREVRFVESSLLVSITFISIVLSAESIQSIIDGLNSEVTEQTLTIPRNAVKKAFETSEGANDGDTSETWNALVASKPNWTISLS